MISGINALNACAASAIARSKAWTAKKRPIHARANSTAAAIMVRRYARPE
jgi:hypothetical protein